MKNINTIKRTNRFFYCSVDGKDNMNVDLRICNNDIREGSNNSKKVYIGISQVKKLKRAGGDLCNWYMGQDASQHVEFVIKWGVVKQ